MSFFFNPTEAADYYKIAHPWMQPKGAKMVYSTWTARSFKHHPNKPKTVIFGQQYTIDRWFIDFFDEEFFHKDIEMLRAEYEEMMGGTFDKTYIGFDKFEALHKLGYLPIAVCGVPEGTLLPVGIPDHVIYNTHDGFAWLPQYLEDLWSANNWLPSTSATTAYYRHKMIRPYVLKTVTDSLDAAEEITSHMCGNFCLRGHTSLEAGFISGAAHALSFDRTATIGSNRLLKTYYGAILSNPPMLGTPSLEHSVVEQGIAYWKRQLLLGDEMPWYMNGPLKAIKNENWEINLIAEMCFILYLLKEVQPTGVMTYVADTYDYFGVLTKILPTIRDFILDRDGCFSIRPDSGDPYKIICGDKDAGRSMPEYRGTLRTLLDIFGYTINDKGCKVLPPQIRMIYGDAITEEITTEVGSFCVRNEIAINNLCFGIGAYTYQYVTRDTRGYAIKATYAEYEMGGEREVFQLYKQPKTDPGKKSPRGCVAVIRGINGDYQMVDGLTFVEAMEYPGNIMMLKFENGHMRNIETFNQIKERLREEAKDDEDNF